MTYEMHYPSLVELIDAATRDTPRCESNTEKLASRLRMLHRQPDWGGMTIEAPTTKALRNAAHDWNANPPADIRARIATLRDSLAGVFTMPTPPRRRRRYGLDFGDTLDPIAEQQRDPCPWSTMLRERRPGQIVRIGANLQINSNESASDLFPRCGMIAALAEHLTAEGFAVEVTAFASYANIHTHAPERYRARLTTVRIKEARQPLDESTLAAVLGHTAIIRCIVNQAAVTDTPYKVQQGLGESGSLTADQIAPYDIVIDRDVTTEREARAALDQLKSRW